MDTTIPAASNRLAKPTAADAGPRTTPLEEDFSIVLGGPLYQALRRARLSDGTLDLVRRRVIAFAAVAWVPLLLLSIADGKAWGDAVAVPFLVDVETHVRFLVALPLLVVAELVVHRRMRHIVAQFVSMGLVQGETRERFDAAIERAMRLRNSVVAELLLVALVYAFGRLVAWEHYVATGASTWYAEPAAGGLAPHPAGWWYFAVSLPLFQFLLVRWYFRLFVWARFLWQVSRLDITFSPMHPDRLGGLGFLTHIDHAFAPFVLAQGALLAGALANRILFDGAVLTAFVLDIAVFTGLILAVVLAPLLVFVIPLAAAKRAGLHAYGHLSKRYIDEFETRWVRGRSAASEAILGSADIQSLADMANGFEVVKEMRVVPLSREMLVQLAILALMPLAPLLLTMVSIEELLGHLVKVVL